MWGRTYSYTYSITQGTLGNRHDQMAVQLVLTLLPVLAMALGCLEEFFLVRGAFFPLSASHLLPWVESGVLLGSQKNKQ